MFIEEKYENKRKMDHLWCAEVWHLMIPDDVPLEIREREIVKNINKNIR